MKALFLIACILGAFPESALAADPGVVNARQIPAILSTLTDISPRYAEIADYYSSNLSRFPQFGTISEVTPIFLLAQVSYASLYCQRFLGREKAKSPGDRWAFGAIDFTQPLAQLRDGARAMRLADDMARQFWARPLTREEGGVLAEELATWSADAKGSLDFVLMSLCSVYLSTPQAWLEPL